MKSRDPSASARPVTPPSPIFHFLLDQRSREKNISREKKEEEEKEKESDGWWKKGVAWKKSAAEEEEEEEGGEEETRIRRVSERSRKGRKSWRQNSRSTSLSLSLFIFRAVQLIEKKKKKKDSEIVVEYIRSSISSKKSFYDEHCHSRTFQAYYIPLVQ